MKINMTDLRRVTEKLFDHLNEIEIEYVEISEDYYWIIPEEQLYEMKDNPVNLGAGQLSDDWAELSGVLEGTKDPIAYDLVRLAAILRAVGESVVR